MSELAGKWSFNNREDDTWPHDMFDTKEEAIKEGLIYAKDEAWPSLFVGRCVEVSVPSPIDVEALLERIAEAIDEEGGSEWEAGDKFLNSLACEQDDDLECLLNGAFLAWVNKHNIRTGFYTIEDIEKVPLEGEEE